MTGTVLLMFSNSGPNLNLLHIIPQMEARLSSIKDPIQRAGVRLLWAAAIPIQTQARRFLARQVAIRRMCAVLTIQAVSVLLISFK